MACCQQSREPKASRGGIGHSFHPDRSGFALQHACSRDREAVETDAASGTSAGLAAYGQVSARRDIKEAGHAPKVELIAKRPTVVAAACKRSCNTSLAKTKSSGVAGERFNRVAHPLRYALATAECDPKMVGERPALLEKMTSLSAWFDAKAWRWLR
jgi:hypothetical protein